MSFRTRQIGSQWSGGDTGSETENLTWGSPRDWFHLKPALIDVLGITITALRKSLDYFVNFCPSLVCPRWKSWHCQWSILLLLQIVELTGGMQVVEDPKGVLEEASIYELEKYVRKRLEEKWLPLYLSELAKKEAIRVARVVSIHLSSKLSYK